MSWIDSWKNEALRETVEDLLESTVKKYPEILETQTFTCPYFQKLSDILSFFEERKDCIERIT